MDEAATMTADSTTPSPTTEAPGYLAQLALFKVDEKGIIWPGSERRYESDLSVGEAEHLINTFPLVTTDTTGASA